MSIRFDEVNTISLQARNAKVNQCYRPTVLIFDSGVGGVSIYQEIRQLLPNIHYIYAFDNQAFPYGEKTEAFIVERVLKIVTRVQQQHPLTLVVIACNTASTVSLPTLRKHFFFPIVGVVPAIKPAVQLTRNKRIGLLATRATIHCTYIQDLIECFAADCQIERLWSSELVKLAEKKLHGGSVSVDALRKILTPWLNMDSPPDTVVLGCTHFPLLAEELAKILPYNTQMVDSGAAIAHRVVWLLSLQQKAVSTTAKNIAYCTQKNANTALLLPVLQQYGFSTMEELPLTSSTP
ncbi:glutamate racemase [Candidatus Regiella endosymbiont of Tuberolachnus salignus]|uniref:glutamate racemase n=1 Tax=Candidatus Regiella endosymbiont of Tuberolachnus salignus TaxID=3077956 RepID=UPI0030D27A59